MAAPPPDADNLKVTAGGGIFWPALWLVVILLLAPLVDWSW